MGPQGLESMSLRPAPEAAAKHRQRAEQVAAQFETVFVRTLVGSLRQTASIGGAGGMFGSGPGADTYADWFDQNLAEQVATSSRLGIREQLLADFERNGELVRQRLDAAATQAAAAASRADLIATRRPGAGGTDVVQ
jgi:Rod binding domain-containing protein